MPALAPLVKQNFRGFGLVLPTGSSGKTPRGFPGDDTRDEQNPAWLFTPATNLGLHVRTVESLSAMLNAFIDEMSEAICSSWNRWQGSAAVSNVLVNAAVGVLPPGGLLGSSDMTARSILGRMALAEEQEVYRRYARAIAGALGEAWTAWATGYTHLTLAFPAAATLPGPLLPTPGLPAPLAMGTSPGDAAMTGASLSGRMKALFGAPGPHSSQLFAAFASALETTFQAWKSGTRILNLVATGGLGFPVAGALATGGVLQGPGVQARPQAMSAGNDEQASQYGGAAALLTGARQAVERIDTALETVLNPTGAAGPTLLSGAQIAGSLSGIPTPALALPGAPGAGDARSQPINYGHLPESVQIQPGTHAASPSGQALPGDDAPAGSLQRGLPSGVVPPPSLSPSSWQLPTAPALPGVSLGGGAPPPSFTPEGGLATTVMIGDLGWEKPAPPLHRLEPLLKR